MPGVHISNFLASWRMVHGHGYLVALRAMMYSAKSKLPLLSSSKTLKRESAKSLASAPSTACNISTVVFKLSKVVQMWTVVAISMANRTIFEKLQKLFCVGSDPRMDIHMKSRIRMLSQICITVLQNSNTNRRTNMQFV